MNRNKQTELLGGIITLIILILLVFLSNVEVNKLSYFETAVNTIISPIQRIITDLKNKIQGNSEYFANMEKIQQENEELRTQNSELETKLRELERIKADNITLQEYMNLTQK